MIISINEIRKTFLSFFKKKEHHFIESSSLVPKNDQTLLFTNSGMNQFKDIFLGIEKPSLKRVVTAQRCMRAGGKHNDLDNVGYTERHLTFFEMLGNFSFGDYFKYDAIQFAWELLTDVNWFNLSKDKLWITTHVCDNESYDIWTKHVGIPVNHIIKIGNKLNDFYDSDNFWQMGDVGPCGPCSEIFYDCGDNLKGFLPGSGKGSCGKRYIEIWNLVFIQFDRQKDGHLSPLSMLSVDTGMGLERITAVLQGVHSNYLIDVFQNLIISISRIMNIDQTIENRSSIYVIADHIRACVFLIQDGVIPSNEGRGYVLRRIIRRAVRHGKKLGVNHVFLYKLVHPLLECMGLLIDKFCEKKDFIEKILLNEEELFLHTLKRGLELLEKELKKLKGNILNGEVVFNLYDTYGFPLELTKDICKERNIRIDHISFEKFMQIQKNHSKRFNVLDVTDQDNNMLLRDFGSVFVGYNHLTYQSKIIAMLHENSLINKINENGEGIVILDNTPFYGESGGQVGDCGYLKTASGLFKVMNTKKYKKTIGHIGIVTDGVLCLGDQVIAQVDSYQRKCISANHSVTHLLHSVLLNVFGAHVIQCGSLITAQYLRFDFTHHDIITASQIDKIENLVNHQIWRNLSISFNILSKESAQDSSAIMFLNKRYEQEVRVVNMGNFSSELCGGTHVARTGDIGLFIIVKESGIGCGVRRIEAVTKNVALSTIQDQKKLLTKVSQIVSSNNKNLFKKMCDLVSRYHALEKQVQVLKNTQHKEYSVCYIKDIYYINDVSVLIKKVKNMELKLLYSMVKSIKNQLQSGVIILINLKRDDVIHLIVSLTEDLIMNNRVSAVDIVRHISHNFGGQGGGRSDFAEAGIKGITIKSTIVNEIDLLLRGIL